MAFPPFLLSAVLWAAPAHAQVLCKEHSVLLDMLAGRYHEMPAAMGIASNGGLLEVLTSDNGSWTIIVTSPHGHSCVVAAGEGWRRLRDPEPEA